MLECKVYSPGEGTIFEWLKGRERWSVEKEGNELEEILMHTSFLVLEEGERATDYSCRVTNDLGEEERRVKAAESNLTLIAILGVSLPLLLLVLVTVFIYAIRQKKMKESLARMERRKQRCLSHRNISFVDDSGGNPGLPLSHGFVIK